MSNTVRIFETATGQLVHELPLNLFTLRPEREDYVKIVAPMFVLLKPEYRIEYTAPDEPNTPAGGGVVTPAARS